MNRGDDQKHLSSIFLPFPPHVGQFYDGWNRAGSLEVMAGKYLKRPAVLSRAKWNSAWSRTSKGSWHQIYVCHRRQLRKKTLRRNGVEFEFSVNMN